MFSLEELYGVDLQEYCKAHQTTISTLIKKTDTDIKLLKQNLKRLVKKDLHLTPLCAEVQRLIRKKEKHLKRLKNFERRI